MKRSHNQSFTSFPLLMIALLLIGSVFTACEKNNNGNGPNLEDFAYALGWLEEAEQEETIQSDLYLGSNGDVPSSVDLVPLFPPVGDQGSYGTCATWAVGYNLKSAIDGIDNNYSTADLTSPANQFSPKDLFWAMDSNDKAPDCAGSTFAGAFDALQARGVATMQTVPYNNLGDCSSSPQSSWTSEAANHKIDNYRKIDIDLNTLKSYIAQKRPIVFGARVGDNFLQWRSGDVITSDTYNYSGQHAYHAMVLAGYDDNKGPNGAFKVINSWSDYWGNGGYAWVDYNHFVGGNFAFVGFVAKNNKGSNFNPDNNGNGQVDPGLVVNGSADLLAWALEDYDDPDYSDEKVRSIAYGVYNMGDRTIQSSENWNISYAYYNAYDANEWDILLYDYYTDDETGQGNNGPLEEGPGSSGNWWNDVDVPGGTSVAAAFGQEYFYWGYVMPEVTGYYYLVLIADGYDDIEEHDEENNYYFVTDEDGFPLYFENGVIQGTVGKRKEGIPNIADRGTPQINAKAPAATTLSTKNLNAYTPNELRTLIKHHKKTGQLQAKIKAFTQHKNKTMQP